VQKRHIISQISLRNTSPDNGLQAGADVVSPSGLAHNNTIKDAVGCARKYGVKIMVDLLEVRDPLKRAKELEKLDVDYICLHSGIDAQRDRKEELTERWQP